MVADIASGHHAAADWLFLIAAVVFLIGAVVDHAPRSSRSPVRFVPLGLVLVAVGWLVL